MLNYWWVTRPKRKLDSVPEVLTVFAEISLGAEWEKQNQLTYETALESAELKRTGTRRDQSGSGARTYGAWLSSLGLIFKNDKDEIKLTLAGEAIMDGKPPVEVLKNQVLKYQFPSSFSKGRNVNVNPRFKIRPFRFLLRLLTDNRLGNYLMQSEIVKIVITEAENETDSCYEYIANRILEYRDKGDACLEDDFITKYKPSRGGANPDYPYRHLEDIANTMVNWVEYTQLARRNDEGQLRILPSAAEEVNAILSVTPPFIDRPEDHEYFQRKYGLDPWHRKDTRNLEQTKTVTQRIIDETKIKQAYFAISLRQPISRITSEIIAEIATSKGMDAHLVEDILKRLYPHGSIEHFMANYYEMAFSGRDKAVDFEKATTELFRSVFGFNAIHLGQTGSLSAPDILLLSDDEGYQSIIDNKAYYEYSISGDHRNRMIYNYIEGIGNYSESQYPIGFFSYIAGGFKSNIDRSIRSIAEETGVNGSCITVSDFISMIRKKESNEKDYTHAELRSIFGLNRQIRIDDI